MKDNDSWRNGDKQTQQTILVIQTVLSNFSDVENLKNVLLENLSTCKSISLISINLNLINFPTKTYWNKLISDLID